ncbi:YxeA family protein [Geomicrobium sp. JCM 19038]|uniref:YxeA family protein n=1 Tax=Geomicrobium sp. JCM 19038 TaxID=1460635 RepID=UPI00045F3CC0|nr:YxeA family protein [Geomicrobium sp. JCM 19038]GAK08115.1 hypothetical protein JCM19038_1886 [Geomicrobium sp. JCM 19038]
MNKRILISCLVVVVAFASLYLLSRETFDRYNPLIATEYVYVEIQDDEPTDDHGRYKYSMQGITESGETSRVVFTTSTRLDEGTHLRVLAKGAYTEEYEFIDEDNIPLPEENNE